MKNACMYVFITFTCAVPVILLLSLQVLGSEDEERCWWLVVGGATYHQSDNLICGQGYGRGERLISFLVGGQGG